MRFAHALSPGHHLSIAALQSSDGQRASSTAVCWSGVSDLKRATSSGVQAAAVRMMAVMASVRFMAVRVVVDPDRAGWVIDDFRFVLCWSGINLKEDAE